MKARFLLLCALALAGLTHAGPLVIEQSGTLLPPDATWPYVGRFGVAIDGDFALSSGERFVEDPSQPNGQRHEAAALLYRRSGADWNFIGPLGPVRPLSASVRPGLAMKGGVALVILDAPRVFERSGSTWTQATLHASLQSAIQGPEIKIDSGRILVPRLACENDAVVIRKVSGTWSAEGALDGNANSCEDSSLPFLDIQGELAAVFNPYLYEVTRPEARVYRRSGNTWSPYVTFPDSVDSYAFGPAIALARPYLAVTGSRQRGTTVFFEVSGGSWGQAFTGLQPADAYLQPEIHSTFTIERLIRPDGTPLFLQRNYNAARNGYVINVFRANPDVYVSSAHVATLQARLDVSLGDQLDVSGQRVIVNSRTGFTGWNGVYVFDLPASLEQPALQTHDFEPPSSGAEWTWRAGSTFTIGSANNNRFFRQTSTAGDAGAWLAGSAGRNQAIQAEVTVQSFGTAGSDRWVGLMTRRRDDSNYYYVTLRQSGSVQLRKLVNGVISTLNLAPMTVTPGRKYRLRLESMGQTHRVYVDDRKVLTAFDPTHVEGTAGVVMYRTSADFDNVLVSPSPQATIFAQDFNVDGYEGDWSYRSGDYEVSQGMYRQTSTVGDARSITGAMTEDSIVQVRVRPNTFAIPTAWVGLLARSKYIDDYVYVSLRRNNTVTLRRLVAGNIYPIAEAPYTVTSGTWYTLRLEIVGGLTRVFVNDQVVIATNTDYGSIQRYVATQQPAVGIVSYRTAADYDDFLAYQP